MKQRAPIISPNSFARFAIWAGVALVITTTASFSLSRADTSPSATTSTSSSDDLPDAPSIDLRKNLIAVKMPRFELQLHPETDIGEKEVTVNQVAFNPSLTTSTNDIQQASNTYWNAVSAVANGSASDAWTNLIASNRADCPSLTPNGKLALLSYYGYNMWKNYNHNEQWSPTSMNTVAESVGKSHSDAGVCREISTALAEIAGACGLNKVGAMFANWQDHPSGIEDPHAVAYYQDPKTGQYIIINYVGEFSTGTSSLPQAADIAAQQLSPTSLSAYVATNLTNKTSMHEIATTRGSAIMGSINNAAELDKSRPAIEFSVGNLNISGSAQAHESLDNGMTVGVYGAADDNRETGAIFGSAGAMISQDTRVQVTKKIDFDSNSQLTMGVFDIHDTDFLKEVRNAFEGIVLIKSNNQVAWHTDHAPGSVTASLQGTDNFTDHFVGVPFNFLSLKLVVDPTQSVRVHADTTEIVTTKTIQDTAITLARTDDSAGIELKKKTAGVTLDSDSTLHFLGGAGHGVVGEEENAKLIFKTHAGSISTGADALVVQNHSADYFYNLPVYCKAKVEYDKTIKGINIQVSGDYRCNHENKLSLPGEQSLGSGDNWEINQPRGSLGLKITWGGRGKTVEN